MTAITSPTILIKISIKNITLKHYFSTIILENYKAWENISLVRLWGKMHSQILPVENEWVHLWTIWQYVIKWYVCSLCDPSTIVNDYPGCNPPTITLCITIYSIAYECNILEKSRYSNIGMYIYLHKSIIQLLKI